MQVMAHVALNPEDFAGRSPRSPHENSPQNHPENLRASIPRIKPLWVF